MDNDIDKMHFYGSTVAEWFTSSNLTEVVRWFARQDLVYNIWMVPGPEESHYLISAYAPQVEGSVWLGTYRKKQRIS